MPNFKNNRFLHCACALVIELPAIAQENPVENSTEELDAVICLGNKS